MKRSSLSLLSLGKVDIRKQWYMYPEAVSADYSRD